MTDKEKKEREEIKFEIRARKELLKRLQYPRELLRAASQKEHDKRQALVKNKEYASVDEAHEAYGYGYITEDEFDAIREAFEKGQDFVDNTTTPVEAANRLLIEFAVRLEREVRYFEFDLLPVAEQDRIKRESEDRHARYAKRHERTVMGNE